MKFVFAALALFAVLLILALFPTYCVAQEAKVIELKAQDAANLKAKYEALQAAQKAYADVQEQITKKYLEVGEGDPDAGSLVQGLTAGNSAIWFNGSTLCLNIGDNSCEYPHEPTQAEKEREKQERKKYRYYRKGWTDGFESSADFRFIVPKAYEPKSKPCETFEWGTPGIAVPVLNNGTFTPISHVTLGGLADYHVINSIKPNSSFLGSLLEEGFSVYNLNLN